MFEGWVLGVKFYTWSGYNKAYNEAVSNGLLKDKNGKAIVKKL